MADTRISGLTALTSTSDDDLIPIVDDPSGTATTKKITIANLKTSFGSVIGTQDIWVPSTAMWATATNGAGGLNRTDSGGNNVNYQTFDFDTSTQEYVQFTIVFPRNYNNSTVTFTPYWTAASGSGGVVWQMKGVALSNDDALDTALGTAQTSTDTLITAADVHVGPESSAITIAGTPADSDIHFFEVSRLVSDGSDTLGVDAKLLGVMVKITIDAGTSS